MSGAAGLERLALHTWTTKPWTLRECVEGYRAAGIGGISVWRQQLEDAGVGEGARMLRDSGLRVVSLVRAGFFVHGDAGARAAAVEDCRRAVADAAAIGAGMVVVVAGSRPGIALADGRSMVSDALGAVVEEAAAQGVRLALEPLHPMYAADRSCVNTLAQARELVERVAHAALGVAVDVFHVWWDDALGREIGELGRTGRLFALHVCDWKATMRDMLNDRGVMGDGCIPIRWIRGLAERAGFDGMIEVEIFSEEGWAGDQREWVARIVRSYLACV